MTTISAPGTSTIEAWMVSKLFGTPSQDQVGDKATTSAATSIATVAAGTSASVSNTTAQALTKLQTGGTTETADEAQKSTEPAPMSVAQSNAIVMAANQMTSEEVSSAMYGNGLPTPGDYTNTNNTTFADLLAQKKETINSMYQAAQDPNLSDTVRQSILDEATKTKSLISNLKTAFDNHTLVFRKASEISGLDYQGSYTFESDKPTSPASKIVASGTYNNNFLVDNPDGQNHALLDAGGLTMFVTW